MENSLKIRDYKIDTFIYPMETKFFYWRLEKNGKPFKNKRLYNSTDTGPEQRKRRERWKFAYKGGEN